MHPKFARASDYTETEYKKVEEDGDYYYWESWLLIGSER